jgi:uncharacterized protein (DUF1330 family)
VGVSRGREIVRPMATYMIVYARLYDEAGFQPYVDAVGPLIRDYGGTLLARSSAPFCLEGNWPWSTAGVLLFDTEEAAKAFWFSEDYARVKALRKNIADFEVILVPGFEQ